MKSLESRPTHPNHNVLTNTPPPLPVFLTVEMRTPAVPSSLLFDYIPGDLFPHDSQTIGVLGCFIFMSLQIVSYIHIVLKDKKANC